MAARRTTATKQPAKKKPAKAQPAKRQSAAKPTPKRTAAKSAPKRTAAKSAPKRTAAKPAPKRRAAKPARPSRRKLTIPPPLGDKEPRKTNVYDFVQFTRCALAPMFPYFDEGAIVPCSATFRGGPGVNYGRFQHFNTVDEILLTFGARGASRSGGLLRVGPRLHMVQSPLQNDQDPENFALAVITQRQSIGKEQKEEYRLVCEKCDRRLFMAGFDATPPKHGTQAETWGEHAPFPTIGETYEATLAFNADEDARTCKHCGHKNPPFPHEAWGWEHYVEQTEVSALAYDAMKASQSGPPPGAAPPAAHDSKTGSK